MDKTITYADFLKLIGDSQEIFLSPNSKGDMGLYVQLEEEGPFLFHGRVEGDDIQAITDALSEGEEEE